MPAATSEITGELRPGPRWAQVDLAWPLAVLAGFLGTWIGLVSGVPWLATPFAFALFLPLAWRVRALGQGTLLTWLGVAFLAGTAGAVAGTTMEDGSTARVLALPLATRLVQAEFAHLDPDHGPADPWATLPRNLACLAGLVLTGRLTAGLGAVFLAGLAAAAVSAGAARQITPETSDPLWTFLTSWPPHLAFALVGGLLIAGALTTRPAPAAGGDPGRFDPPWELLGPGLALAALGLLGQGLWLPLWAAWAR